MRIGLVIANFDPRLGGAEQWTWQFAHWLVEAGHEVHLFAARFGPAIEEMPAVRHRIEHNHSRIGFANAAAEALARVPLDVVHDMGTGWKCDLFQPHGGSRQAAFEQNLMLASPLMRPLKRRLAKCLPRYREFGQLNRLQYGRDGRIYLALSARVARDFQRFHGVAAEQIRIVYNGVDTDRFSPERHAAARRRLRSQFGLSDDEVLLLIVAHNFELKGVPTAIRAVGRLRRQGAPVRLAVVGGKRLSPCQALAQDCGAGRAVTFLGPVDDAAIYYSAADIYVQPTWYDPCSLVVLEALASGLPVITSQYNGAGELIDEGLQGYLMDDPADDRELAQRVSQLLAVSVRRSFSQSARQLALGHTLNRNCAQIMDIYQEIWQQKRQAA
jgi:UDP-glucose:(heptosyl)LPS alpha-1,3-glucosyltransferase